MIKRQRFFFIVIISLLLIITSFSCNRVISPEEARVTNMDVLLNVPGEDYIMLSGEEVTKEGESAQFEADISNNIRDVVFLIRRGSPNLTDILVSFDDTAYNLIYDLEIDTGFDDFGNLLTGYYTQLTAYDLDSDGKKEVIVSVGDKSQSMSTTVFKFTDKTDDPGDSPFKNLGTVNGQKNMHIEKNKIRVPVEGVEQAVDYKIENNKLVRTRMKQ